MGLLMQLYEEKGFRACSFPPKSVPAPVAYQLIRDMRQLDSNPRLNLASFVVGSRVPQRLNQAKANSTMWFHVVYACSLRR